jgi:cell division protein FtsQ
MTRPTSTASPSGSRAGEARRAPVLGAQDRLAERAAAERGARRRSRLRGALLGLLVLTASAALGWVLLVSSWLAVAQVTVAGTSRLTPEQVTAAAAVPTGVPLARLDAGQVERRVRALPPVADVEVVRSWPSTLHLEVVERQPVAVHAGPEGLRLLDGTGVAFAPVPRVPDGLVRIEVDTPLAGDPATTAALAVAAALPPELRELVEAVSASSGSAVQLRLDGGRTVLWGSPDDALTKVAAVRACSRWRAPSST